MAEYTQIVVLCEDRQQEVFARHFLVNCGINRHRIYPKVAPKGEGSGEHYVRRRYPQEVHAYRTHCNRINIALVVLLDADTRSLDERHKQLDGELERAGFDRRQSGEKIGVFIPKRNIDTWVHYLQGEPVNEVEAYSKFEGNEGICKPLVAELARNRTSSLPEDAPSSLKAACEELHRVL
jgi:hypothetical protein